MPLSKQNVLRVSGYKCNHILSLIIFFICFIPAIASADANIVIDEANIIGPVNRNVLGNNIIGYMKPYKKGVQKLYFDTTGGGLWNPKSKTFDKDYIRLIRLAGVSVLRWPGGPWLDSLQWKNLVGPVKNRPRNTFGLPEFLKLCEIVGAKPVITLPTKHEQLAQIPDLIEYLNGADDGSNPNAGIDWAKVRSGDGHALPWNVKWFEFGNETFGHNMSPEEYVKHYIAVYNEIMKIDNSVMLGAVMEDSDNTLNSWNQIILSNLGDKMGFAVIHPYLPVIKKREAKFYTQKTVALSTMASDAFISERLTRLNQFIYKQTGRSDLKIAATEYNGNFVQNDPIRYRFTLFNAIHNANYVRLFLQPKNNILFANHWHLVNSYWGMIRENKRRSRPLIKQANYYVYELYHKYLKDKLVQLKIDSPVSTFNGAGKVPARKGNKVEGGWEPYAGKLPEDWDLRYFSDVEQSQDNGVVTAIFKNEDLNYYHASKTFSVKPDTLYRVSVKVKSKGLVGGKVGIAVEDVRGWNKMFNQPANIQLKGTSDWHWISTQIRSLPDSKKLRVITRRLKGKGKISGEVKFADLRVEESHFHPGSIQAIVGVASKSDDDQVISLIVLNKELNRKIDTKIQVPVGYQVDHAVKLSGTSPFVTNLKNISYENISVTKSVYSVKNGVMGISLLPMSMNAIEFRLEK